MSEYAFVLIVTGLVLGIPALTGGVAGRADQARVAVLILALCAALLTVVAAAMVYLRFGRLIDLPGYPALVVLIGGFTLSALGYVLGLSAAFTALTGVIVGHAWDELWRLGPGLLLLLATACVYDSVLFGAFSQRLNGADAMTLVEIGGGAAGLGALGIAAWSLRAWRAAPGHGAWT